MAVQELHPQLVLAENIVETVREPLLILDDHLQVIKANDAFYRTFHVSPEETLRRRIYDLGNGQWDIPSLRELLERILPENSHFDDFEVEHTFETIGPRIMLVNARRVVQGGEMILLAIEDITERRRVERAERFLACVIESSDDSIVTVDLDGVITTWNRTAEKIYGYASADIIGRPLEMLSTPEEKVPVSTYLDKVRRGARVERVEIQRVTKDGRRKWLSVQFSPIKDAGGNIVGISTISRDITERHEANRALTESKELLHKAVSGETVGVLFFNLKGGITDANETFSRMSGYTREELRHSVHWKMLTAPEFVEASIREAECLATTGEAQPYEKIMIRKDGSRWWGLFAPMRLNDRGWDSDCMEFIIDITERKRAEDELRLSRQLLETIVNYLPAGVAFVRGSDLSFQMVNPRYQAISPNRQMVGKRVGEVWPEAMPVVEERYRRVLETGEPFHVYDEHYPVRRKPDGALEALYFTWSIHRVNLPGENEPGLLITVWETTERKKMELVIREYGERYQALFNSIDEGFCVIQMIFDQNGAPQDYRFLEINPAFEKHTGLKHAQDRTIRELVPDVDRHWFEIYGKVARTGEPARCEEYSEPLHSWFDVFAFRIGTPEEHKVAVLFTNVTDRKTAHESLEQTVAMRTAALKEINKQMEAFTYTIAHDLRAPLRAQQGFATALLQDYGEALGETGRDYAERIISSADRLDDLVNDLLAFSRLDRTELQLRKIDLRKTVTDVCQEMAFHIHEAKAKIQIDNFDFQISGHEPTLRTAITNLLSNGIKFHKPDATPEVRIRAEDRGKCVRLWVEDNGIGIAPEHQHQIFGVFHRLHPIGDYPGTGVGLAIVQKGIERMDGSVGVESQEGHGSRFWLQLKKAEE